MLHLITMHPLKLPIAIGTFAAIIIVIFPRAMAFLPALLALTHVSIHYLTSRKLPVFSRQYVTPLLILIVLNFASILWSIDASVSLERCLKLLPIYFGGFVLMIWASNHKEIARSSHLYFYGIAVIVTIGAMITIYDLNLGKTIYRFFRNIPSDEHLRYAIYNRGTIILTLLSFSLLGYFLYAKRSLKTLILPFLSLGILMIYTDSQSSQLSLLIGLIFFFTFPYRYRMAWIALISLVIILTLSAPFLMPLLYNQAEFINSLPFFGKGMGYAGPRLEIWDYVSRYALDKPFLGYGIEATKIIEDFDSRQVFREGNTILHPHNFALQLWIEFGVIGAAAGAGLISWLVWRISQLQNIHGMRVCLATLMATLSVASTGYGIWQSWWLGAIFFILAVNMYLIKSLAKEYADTSSSSET